ncbi:MAG TPA: hypothetical protein VNV85_02815 [Puia sp.]|nr:hypothetical protein [Puia sp.]
MIQSLPLYITIVFILTTAFAVLIFHYAVLNSTSNRSAGTARIILSIFSFWLVFQAVISLNEFYIRDTTSIPPRFALAIIPPFITILILFLTKRGLVFIDNLPLLNITYLNIVRIPVEIVLYWLFLHKAVPRLMTFEGKNFDIISGITAPLIAYFGFKKGKLSNKVILYWNVIALLLLLNVLAIGILSAPLIFQVFSFLQPNIAVLYFPFVWLPAFLVPLIFFGHMVSIRQLLKSIKQIN